MTYRFTYRPYRLTFRTPVRTAHGLWREREGVWVRLEDLSKGIVGYGEAAPIPAFGTETAADVQAACTELGDTIAAGRLTEMPRAWTCLRHALNDALGAIAAHDPGAERAEATPTHETLPVAALLPAGRSVLEAIAPKAEAGFRIFKWKVGVGDPGDELALLDDVCSALPDGAKLRLDANGAWNRRVAERWLERCADRPVEYVEQPVFAAAADGASAVARAEDTLRGLAQDFPTPLALDESLISDQDVSRWIQRGWSGIFVLKPTLLADPRTTIAQLAAAKASVVFSSALETALGARAALRWAFEWSASRRALGFGVWPLFADRRFDGPTALPFLHWRDIAAIDPAEVWGAAAATKTEGSAS